MDAREKGPEVRKRRAGLQGAQCPAGWSCVPSLRDGEVTRIQRLNRVPLWIEDGQKIEGQGIEVGV